MRLRYPVVVSVFLALAVLSFLPVSLQAKERSVIIKFRHHPGRAEHHLVQRQGGKIHRRFPRISAIKAKISEHALHTLKRNPEIEYIEEDLTVMSIEALPTEALPVAADEYDNSWGVRHIGGDIVHGNNIKGHGVKVAMLDTGIDYTHNDLMAAYHGGVNLIYGNDDPYDDSTTGHGTHVAGILGAAEDGFGVIGVAPEAMLYAVKVLDWTGFGTVSMVIDGIHWAIDNEMDIVNMSIGLPVYSQALEDICRAAEEAGILLVAAAGNTYGKPVYYPAAFPSVIAVSAINQTNETVLLDPVDPEIELVAPGVGIYSTDVGQGYKYFAGTSQAAPHVAGTAALLLSAGITDSNGNGRVNDDVRMLLQKTASDLGIHGRDELFGFGLVDAAAAVEEFAAREPILFTLTRGATKQQGRVTVPLRSGIYLVSITNHSLRKVRVEVRGENQKHRRRSLSISFNRRRDNQSVSFTLDATNKDLDVTFTPKGRVGSSADIEIRPHLVETTSLPDLPTLNRCRADR